MENVIYRKLPDVQAGFKKKIHKRHLVNLQWIFEKGNEFNQG